MKKILLYCAAMFLVATAFAQVPQKMSYQAVVRNGESALVVNQTIGVKISILQGSATGTEIYSETQTPQTNANGLISIEIGGEDGFAAINWGGDVYFLKTEIDPTGGANYSIVTTQQLLSVPFALHAKTAETVATHPEETDPVFSAWDKSTGISITEQQISDLHDYLTTEIDPTFAAWDKTTGIVITESQISDLQTYITTELDPIYAASIAAGITGTDTANWNAKIGEEADPLFTAWDKSTGITINENQISDLQNYLTEEVDPQFNAWDKSTGIVITESQISDLQNYLMTEIDPIFSDWDKTTGIVITESQISDLQTYITTELDPIYAASIAAGITEADTAAWNAKVSIETDPIYAESIAAGITETDIANWNAKLSEETQSLENVVAINNSANNQIKNVSNPTDPQDAATKSYTDALIASLIDRIATLEANIPKAPAVTTLRVTQVKKTSAIFGGNVTDDGEVIVSSRGFCWDTSSNPTFNNNYTVNGSGTGIFTHNITGLTSNTTYYLRAYAINCVDTAYGEIISFISADSNSVVVYGNGVTDLDGNVYQTVIIDTMEWMAENLKTTKFNDSTDIPYVIDNLDWTALTTPSYSHYDHDPSFTEIYGLYYNWYTVETGILCPTGWHVASDDEWTALTNFVGTNATAGYYLKSTSGLWRDNDVGEGPGIDLYGFAALPSGWRRGGGEFQLMYDNARFWTSTKFSDDPLKAYQRTLSCCGNSSILRANYAAGYGYPVRCVKNRTE